MQTVIVRLRDRGSDLLSEPEDRGYLDQEDRAARYNSLQSDFRKSSREIVHFLEYTRYNTEYRTPALFRSFGAHFGGLDILSDESEIGVKSGVFRFEPLLPCRSFAVTATDDVLDRIGGFDEVEEIHPNYLYKLPESDSDLLLTTPSGSPTAPDWHLNRIGVTPGQMPHHGRSVKVAVLDTGLDKSHPEFHSLNVAAWMEWDDMGVPIQQALLGDSNGHGTMVTGILCGSVHGVAPGVELHVGRIAPHGTATFAQITNGLDWAAKNQVDILSMSVGKPGYDKHWEQCSAFAAMTGMLVVAAIGNQGPGTSRSPGDYRSTLSVGATDRSDQAWVSQNNPAYGSAGGMISAGANPYLKPDIYAPGALIRSSVPSNSYMVRSGTSFAAPAVAGVAALVKDARPSATPQNLRDHLLRYSTPINLPQSLGGNGKLVSASKALAAGALTSIP